MTERQRIIIFSTAYFPLVGGAEVAIKELTDRLLEFDFILVTARLKKQFPKIEKIGRIEVHRLGWGNNFDKILLALFGGRYGEKLNRQNNFSLIWAMMASYGGFSALSFKKKNKNIPFLLTLQEGDDLLSVENKARLVAKRFREIFISADYIQVISNYLGDWAKKMGATCPVEVVPNGVNLKKIKDDFLSTGGVDGNLNKNGEDKIIITTSRLVKKNGISDLIKSLTLLPSEFKLWILGTGSEENKLKQLVEINHLSERVEFLGLVAPDKILSYLTKADIFVRPSLSEGLGNSFLEAMAVGVPIIGTPVGGIPDFLIDGQTGWFCQVNDPKDIADKILYISNHREEVQLVTEQATRSVEEKYDWDIVTEKIKNIFRKLIYEKRI